MDIFTKQEKRNQELWAIIGDCVVAIVTSVKELEQANVQTPMKEVKKWLRDTYEGLDDVADFRDAQ